MSIGVHLTHSHGLPILSFVLATITSMALEFNYRKDSHNSKPEIGLALDVLRLASLRLGLIQN